MIQSEEAAAAAAAAEKEQERKTTADKGVAEPVSSPDIVKSAVKRMQEFIQTKYEKPRVEALKKAKINLELVEARAEIQVRPSSPSPAATQLRLCADCCHT